MPQLSSMKQNKTPIRFQEGIIPVYGQIIGPRHKCTIKMALDTGATYTIIPAEKVIVTGHKLPTSKEELVMISTASGIEYVPLVTISSFKCLGITVKNINVVCHSLPSESPVEGLLGLNFLSHFPAFIEFYQKLHLR